VRKESTSPRTAADLGAGVLDYWRTVELFAPQKVERVRLQGKEPVYPWNESTPPPWEPSHPIRQRQLTRHQTWLHRVYCSVYRYSAVREIVVERLGRGEDLGEAPADVESCLFAFSVADDGRPVSDSLVAATAPWAAGRLVRPGPGHTGWLEGFDRMAEDAREAWAMAVLPESVARTDREEAGGDRGVADSVEATGDDAEPAAEGESAAGPSPLQWKQVQQAITAVARALAIPPTLVTREVRISPVVISRKKGPSPDGIDFINSFFVKDLARVADEVRAGRAGTALARFLSDAECAGPSHRVDVRTDGEVHVELLSPAQFPEGKWPTQGHHALVFSQQLAINGALAELWEGGGLFAVNGPPGSGKTTLLRDLIAAVVVERAKRLSRFETAQNAFAGEVAWSSGSHHFSIPKWKKELHGFEIVVASCNNGAVENVTLEIPAEEAVDPSWLDAVDYFRDHAERVIGRPAWALMAACLGKGANRRQFVKRLWWPDPDAPPRQKGAPARAADGLQERLRAWEREPADWRGAVERFREALEREGALRERQIARHEEAQRPRRLARDLAALEASLAGERSAREATGRRHAAKAQDVARAEEEVARASEAEKAHQEKKPGALERISSMGRAIRPWKAERKRLAADTARLEARLSELRRGKADAERELADRSERVLDLERNVVAERLVVEMAIRAHQGQTGWPAEDAARERSAPWADAAWAEARVRVFLEALALHRSFVIANAKKIRLGLQAAMQVLEGGAGLATEEAVRAAWTTFFFVVPVVSTTFASFERMFARMGRESLGWLLIDEAGQAPPQSASGAIWRSRRVLVVGDPQQLEPIVEVPHQVLETLRVHHRVGKEWVPGPHSVQLLADRVVRHGTTIDVDDRQLWVGAPLRVHRRCDDPMFAISNEIAYGGLMVNGTPAREPIALPESCWFDVAGPATDDHWIETQGKVVEDLLRILARAGMSHRKLFLVSPYRSVAKHLESIARRRRVESVGTVHRVQGKEADVVLFVLGGNEKPGSRRFATERPNLVNVAITRARRRLYVIGDRSRWGGERYFDVLAANLPAYPWPHPIYTSAIPSSNR
jgi:hypothetical protein